MNHRNDGEGLPHASQMEKEVWVEFAGHREELAQNAANIRALVLEGAQEAMVEAIEKVLPESEEDLRPLALAAASLSVEGETRLVSQTYHHRSAVVRKYACARADGVCESCRQPSPFARKNGKPYLEVHHIESLADNGPDHPDRVVALCPNCHREVHYGADGAKKNEALRAG